MSAQARWARLLLETLSYAGVEDAVLSPGARSTPLVWAASGCEGIRVHDVIDERAAAAFALGRVRVTGRPTLLICTSGGAPAHYLPAVIEASESHLPLIILSADRPFELHGSGSNQTTDQVKLFGSHVRRFVDLGIPEARLDSMRALRRVASQAVATSLSPLPGPVHLNFRARKPLEPVLKGVGSEGLDASSSSELDALAFEVPTRVWSPPSWPSPEGIEALAADCRRATRGVIVSGPAPLERASSRRAVEALSRRLGFPLLAEATSQLRFGRGADVEAIDGFDALLRSARGRALFNPDLVIQLGEAPIAKGWELWLEENPEHSRWVVAPHGWPDPSSSADHLLRAGIPETLDALHIALGEGDPTGTLGVSLLAADARVSEIAASLADVDADPLSEAAAVRILVGSMHRGDLLAAGNSLSIRHLDAWAAGGGPAIEVLSQRGVSGIDGLVAGAAGACSAAGRSTALLLGDVSFAHDLGGLAAARGLEAPLLIVVLDNAGGRIFDHLPVASRLPELMPHFTTPPGLDIEAAARAYGHAFARVESADGLRGALAEGRARAGATVIRVVVPPEDAAARNRELHERVDAMLAERPG